MNARATRPDSPDTDTAHSASAARKTRGPRPARKLVEHALSLIGRCEHGDADTAAIAARDLAAWRAQDPAHEAAATLAQAFWAQTDGTSLREEVGMPRRVDGAARHSRRQMLAWMGSGALVAALGGTARWQWLQPTMTMALRTGQGEVRPHTLPDGSVVTLAPNTDVQVAYYRNRRDFTLTHGGVHLDVQPDAARPLSVATQWGNVRVLGTIFTVALRDDGMDVAVARGKVAVWARSPDGLVNVDRTPDVTLGAGQAVSTSTHGIALPEAVTPQSVGAWREGWLVFHATPLTQALAQWNDFLAQPIRVADGDASRLRGLRLTGTFPVADPAGFLQGLPAMLPVRVRREQGQPVVAALR